jgi:site-specific DNA-methyltransferase (adenine-specific)/site-specific DNA-methyltransferase (cytosine-N4-specific)
MNDVIINANCLDGMRKMAEESVDAIITSPPYGMQRVKQYGGHKEEEYVKWFHPIACEMLRVLSPRGSLILNIKGNYTHGHRTLYVYKLVIDMVEHCGWRYVDDIIWYKTSAPPVGDKKCTLRDAWEHCFHFAKSDTIDFHKNAIAIPAGDWAKRLLDNKSYQRKIQSYKTATGSGFEAACYRHFTKHQLEMVYPDNVLMGPPDQTKHLHPATFPIWLPDWFIRLFTVQGQTVLDPFAGSGTTLVAAKSLGRHYAGFDLDPSYCQIAQKRLDSTIYEPQFAEVVE